MRELIRGYAAAVLESSPGDGAAVIAAELTSFGRALLDYADLRQAVGEGMVEPALRRAIVSDLLSEKASAATEALASFAAFYERPSEFSPTIGGLALLAEDVGHGASADPATGRAAARERLRGYAERVLEELGGSEEIDQVEDELFAIARLLDEHVDLRRALADTGLEYAQRAAILSDLLAGRAQPATARLAAYTLRAGRTRDLVGTFEWLVQLAARERGRRVAEVRSAVPLAPEEVDRLAVALGRLVHRTVEVRVIEDPAVVGGLLVTVGDLVIDGTVRLRFERLRDLLAQPS